MTEAKYAAKEAYRGDIASLYDEHRIREPLWTQEQAFVGEWIGAIPPGRTVLDIPTGTGRFLELFKNQCVKVHAWDISKDMLEEIHRRFAPLPAGWDVRQADAESLDLSNGAVNYIISWRFFHLIPAPVLNRVLCEFRRVCLDTVVVQVFAVRHHTPWQTLKDWMRPFWWKIRLFRRSAPTEPWAHITSYSHYEEDLLAAFVQAGLVLREARTLSMQGGLANRVYFLEPVAAPPAGV